jgi:hypothetical protein
MKRPPLKKYLRKIENHYIKKHKKVKGLSERQNLVQDLKRTKTFKDIGLNHFTPPITRQRVQQIYNSAVQKESDNIIQKILLEVYQLGMKEK